MNSFQQFALGIGLALILTGFGLFLSATLFGRQPWFIAIPVGLLLPWALLGFIILIALLSAPK